MRSPRSTLVWLGLLLSLGGCATRAPLACPQAPAGRAAQVLFATDRRQDDPAKRHGSPGSLGFGPDRSDPPVLQMGWQEVRLGPRHRLGSLDSAVSLAPAAIRPHGDGLPLQSSLRQSDREIVSFATSTIRAAIHAGPPPGPGERRQVLLFIHGYNDTFDYAILKTAQLAADLDLVTCQGQMRGVAIAYSWPAEGTFLSYLADEENAEWTQQRFVVFLKALAAITQQEGADLHIIAHSMGARLLVRGLAEISIAGGAGAPGHPLFSQIILLAPDIGRELFNQYAERALPLIGHMTLYVSAKDRALALSSILHGGHHRLGLIESTLGTALNLTGLTAADNPRELAGVTEQGAVATRIDMVDVTGGLTDLVGHSYGDPAFIADLRALIHHHTPAGVGPRANLEPREIRPGLFGLIGPRLKYYRLRTAP